LTSHPYILLYNYKLYLQSHFYTLNASTDDE